MEIEAFFGLVGHYRQFIKGFAQIAQPLNKHLSREGASRKSEWVSLSENALEAFLALKWACMCSPVLALLTIWRTFYSKQMLLRRDWSTALPETSRWALSPSSLQQLSTNSPWKELSLDEIGVSGIEMGHHGTFSRVLVVPTLFSENWK